MAMSKTNDHLEKDLYRMTDGMVCVALVVVVVSELYFMRGASTVQHLVCMNQPGKCTSTPHLVSRKYTTLKSILVPNGSNSSGAFVLYLLPLVATTPEN